MNKRGSLQDIIFFGIVVLFFGIAVLLGFKIANETNNQIQTMNIFSDQPRATETATQLVGYYPGIYDNMFLFLVIGMGLVTLVLAALVRIHPLFIPFFFIGLLMVIFFSGILSNIYQEMAANTQISTEANQLTFITNILTVLPFIVGIFGTLMMVVLYKTRDFV